MFVLIFFTMKQQIYTVSLELLRFRRSWTIITPFTIRERFYNIGLSIFESGALVDYTFLNIGLAVSW